MSKKHAFTAAVAGALAVAGGVFWLLASGPSGERPTADAATVRTPVTPTGDVAARPAPGDPGQAGIKAYLDPETGKLLAGPPAEEAEADPARLAPTAEEWINTYGKDLVQQPLEQGGYMVNLEGRFRSAVTVTIDPDTGEVASDCVAETDEPGQGGHDGAH